MGLCGYGNADLEIPSKLKNNCEYTVMLFIYEQTAQ
jgi:hypothetical protein